MTKKILVAVTISVFFTSFILINGLSKKQPTSNLHIVKAKTIVNKKVAVDKVVKKVIKKPVVKKVEVVKKISKVVKITKKVVKKESGRKAINILVSYYTNDYSSCQSTSGISASGKNLVTASRGGSEVTYIAAPGNIPFKTKINIRGVGICSVVDRGGGIYYTYIKGTRYMKVDVFVPNASHRQLLNKGIMKTKGYIIRN